MSRLTIRDKNGYAYDKNCYSCKDTHCDVCDTTCFIVKKLTDYEDLEEQGLLLKLPCKVGDTVWCVVSASTKVVECTVLWIEYHRNGTMVFSLDGGLGDVVLAHLGKVWFLTKEEAEQALERMKEGM